MPKTRKCPVCKKPVIRGDHYVTCSKACTAIYRDTSMRWSTKEGKEKHRLYKARSVLRNPEKYNTSMNRWAKKVVREYKAARRKAKAS